MTVRNSNDLTLTGWPAVGVLATIIVTQTLTALVMAYPLAWLVTHEFSPGILHLLWGEDHLSYWRCVGLFALWHAARVKIKVSGPAPERKEIRG
ncbi:MAG: hypothetical protein ACLGRW_08900 [Acidobacteriota bacterium]